MTGAEFRRAADGPPRTPPGLTTAALAVTMVALNQTMHVAGINLSLADPFVLIVILSLAVGRQLHLPMSILFSAVAVVGIALVTTVYVTPMRFGTVLEGRAVVGDLVKLATSFLYLLCGYGIAKLGLAQFATRWFALGAAAVGMIGALANLLGVPIAHDLLYFAGVRFRGLMADPNFYSVLACAAIAYFLRVKYFSRFTRWVLISGLVYSIVLSGSKTGFIGLVVLFIVVAAESALLVRKSVGLSALLACMLAAVVCAWGAISRAMIELAASFSDTIPQLDRLAQIFSDSSSAASDSGSGRVDAWSAALQIIQSSPWSGIGVGSYSAVNLRVNDERALAHNTYLQLAAEWGLPLAFAFFSAVVIVVLVASVRAYRRNDKFGLAVRDIIIVFLIGSASLSLNNARMFWLFLGVLVWRCVANGRPAGSAQNSESTREKNGNPPVDPQIRSLNADARRRFS